MKNQNRLYPVQITTTGHPSGPRDRPEWTATPRMQRVKSQLVRRQRDRGEGSTGGMRGWRGGTGHEQWGEKGGLRSEGQGWGETMKERRDNRTTEDVAIIVTFHSDTHKVERRSGVWPNMAIFFNLHNLTQEFSFASLSMPVWAFLEFFSTKVTSHFYSVRLSWKVCWMSKQFPCKWIKTISKAFCSYLQERFSLFMDEVYQIFFEIALNRIEY